MCILYYTSNVIKFAIRQLSLKSEEHCCSLFVADPDLRTYNEHDG